MLDHYLKNLPMFDWSVRTLLRKQCLDAASEDYGTVRDVMRGYTEPGNAIEYASVWIAAFYCPESEWYGNPLLMERAALALRHSLRRHNDDNTMDLMETNFHDPTYSAFKVHSLGPAYKLMLQRTNHTPAEEETAALAADVMRRAADAMVNGGFHTPNHRWVLSGALSYCYRTSGDERCAAQIRRYLNEGIDCDENGEFTERSAGVYNIVCDRALMMVSEEMEMPELISHVARNLRMVLTYLEPDYSINTLNSTRQDFGKDGYMYHRYYEAYLKAALHTGDPQFAWIADRILTENCALFTVSPEKATALSPAWFLLYPEMREKLAEVQTAPPDFSYDHFYEASGIVRKRSGDASLTLLMNHPVFLKLQYKNKKLYMRLAGSFFGGAGQFSPQRITAENGGYRLFYHAERGYKRPLSEPPASSNWSRMDHSARETVGVQYFDAEVFVRMEEEEIVVSLDVCTAENSCRNVPMKLELMMDSGALFENDGIRSVTRAGDYLYQKSDSFRYTFSDLDEFRADGCFFAHSYGKSMRGALPGDAQAFTVCMTGYTPLRENLRIRFR